jgi:hypothetical protein
MVEVSGTIYQIAQMIIPQTEGPFDVTSLWVYVNKAGVPDNADISVTLFDDTGEGGYPGTVLAYGATINTGDMTVPGWVEFVLDTSVTMYNGTTYWAVAAGAWSTEEAPASNYWSLGYSAANPYIYGSAVTWDFFAGYADLPGDIGFQIWGDDTGGGGDPPAQASDPTPADSATGVTKADLTLQWTTGEDETGQDVYFGPTGSMVLVSSGQAGHTYDVAGSSLDLGATYQWRVDTINDYGQTEGLVWTFAVEAFAPPADLTIRKFLVLAANSKLFYET